MHDFNRIAEALFPSWKELETLEQLEARFPPRDLPPGAMVTRVGPSPTGMMHLGGLYTALINRTLADQSGGLFFLRIEDTDQKRTVAGALDTILDAMEHYDLLPAEGPTRSLDFVGEYGPYIQTQRVSIYNAVAFRLLRAGKVYPCFMTAEDLDRIRAEQQSLGLRPGVYGDWAAGRRLSTEEILNQLKAGTPYVLRLLADGNRDRTISWDDAVRGELSLPENDIDAVLIKSDGIPTYHFAHLVDDHLMRTTHVIRAEEWIPSVSLHLQLHQAIGWQPPKYGHVAAIYKQDGSSRRKLSKRKDPEADVRFYWERGFPKEAVIDYLFNLANSNFEDWRRANPVAPHSDFGFSLAKMGVMGPLADLVKLESISRERFAVMPSDQLFDTALMWAKQFEPRLGAAMERDVQFTKRALDIERVGTAASKRIATFADLRSQLMPFYDEFLPPVEQSPFPPISREERDRVLATVVEKFNDSIPAGEVFDLLKTIAAELGYASSAKEFKASPEKFKGHVGDVAMIVRVAMLGSTKTPDLGQTMTVLGRDGVVRRCRRVLESTARAV